MGRQYKKVAVTLSAEEWFLIKHALMEVVIIHGAEGAEELANKIEGLCSDEKKRKRKMIKVKARCMSCDHERDICEGEVGPGDMPECDKCFSVMVAVSARGGQE